MSADRPDTAALLLLGHGRPVRVIAGFAWLATLAPAAVAQPTNQQQLGAVRNRIEAVTRELNDTRGQRDALREELRALDQNIDKLAAAARRTERSIEANQSRLRALRRQAEVTRQQLGAQAAALEGNIRAAYALGRQDYLKLLLNQEDPARVARTLTYYRYLGAARSERITQLHATLASARQLEEKIRESDRELSALRADAAEKKTAFEAERARRATVLAQLNREVRERSQELERLKADQQRLEGLVRRLTQYLPELPPPDRDARFSRLKGRLAWPTAGALAARFGESKQVGTLRWRGVLIAAREGTEVHSVASGRVAYADWLRGFGLLLILDHGDGYMTLYGHNQALHKEVGNWVEAGETIAAVGSSGDAPQAGLYFEIRHQGEPVDPLVWVGGRGRAARR